MSDKLDWTKPLALRRSPHDVFEGPFLRQKGPYPFVAIVDDEVHYWREDGRELIFSDRHLDLIQWTPALSPAARKWRHMVMIGNDRNYDMIERAAPDELAEALRKILGNPEAYSHGVARDALAKWEAGL